MGSDASPPGAGDGLPEPLRRLVAALPGTTARDLLPDLPGRLVVPADGAGGAGARPAAVLLLISPGPGGPAGPGGRGAAGLDVVLVERAGGRGAHAGQVAFPGGGVDPGDASTAAAALREAREETGLDPTGVHLLGSWPALPVPVSRYVVEPVLGWQPVPTALAPGDPREIAGVRRVPLAVLADPGHRVAVTHRTPTGAPSGGAAGALGGGAAGAPSGGTATTPAFVVDELLVWGFTGMLLDALLRLSGLHRPWDRSAVVDLPARWAGSPG